MSLLTLARLKLTPVAVCRTALMTLFFGLLLLSAPACQTGRADCDMVAMDAGAEDQAVCLLACGLPFFPAAAATVAVTGQARLIEIPTLSPGTNRDPEPAFRPPRGLA